MGVEDNFYQISGLTATTTFYEWVNVENTDIITKLNLMSIYGASAGDGNIGVIVGTTGNSYDVGDVVVSLSETITGITVDGDLVITGSLFHGGNSADNPFVSSITRIVSGLTGATSNFSIGDVVRGVTVGFVGATAGITFAKSDNEEHSETTIGVIKTIGTNYIDIVTSGYVSGLSGTTSGTLYYLDSVTAGSFNSSKPTAVGEVVKPIIVGLGVSAGIVINQLGVLNLDAGVTGSTGATGDVTDPIFVSDNQLINGNFDIWQRGLALGGSTGNAYHADRWSFWTNWPSGDPGNAMTTSSRFGHIVGQIDVPGDPPYVLGLTFTHGASGTTGFHSGGDSGASAYFMGIENRLENPERFLNEVVHVDGYIKGSTGATLDFYLRRSHDGTTYDIEEFNHSLVVGTSWSEIVKNHTVASLGKTASINSTNGYVAIGIKLNNLPTGERIDLSNMRVFSAQGGTLIGSPFREKTDSEEERLKCSRFYQKTYALDKFAGYTTLLTYFQPDYTAHRFSVSPTPGITSGTASMSENYHNFPVEMRAIPTVSFYSPHTGVLDDGYNRTAKLDCRLTSGTVGYNTAYRVHHTGTPTLRVGQIKEDGVIFEVLSGAVVLDDIYLHYIADADFDL